MNTIPPLSEAIRLSIGVVREYRLMFLFANSSGEPCGCALGTAGYSVGLRHITEEDDAALVRHFPILLTNVRCPYHGDCRPLHYVISRLHCGVRWSRERIADWVATLEETLDGKHSADATSKIDEQVHA